MGLSINSNFTKVSMGASASMKNYQGAMSRSLTRISSGKRYAAGGSASAVSVSLAERKQAAKYETLYYEAQQSGANLNKAVVALESALEAQITAEVKSEEGDESAAAAISAAATAIGSDIANYSASISNIALGAGSGLALNKPTVGDNATATASTLASAYGDLTAADYVAGYLQNVTGAAQAAADAVTDTDIALEMSKYIKANINSQAAQAMVSQANQSMATMLNLLQF